MRALLLALLVAATGTAQAQTVYRCGPEGREYRQTPCPGGQAVDVADPRSEEQRREAAQVSRREAGLAQELRRERESRESRTASKPARIAVPRAAQKARGHTAAATEEKPSTKRRAWAPKPPEETSRKAGREKSEKQPF